jgi:hypothetical protein
VAVDTQEAIEIGSFLVKENEYRITNDNVGRIVAIELIKISTASNQDVSLRVSVKLVTPRVQVVD